MKRIEHTRGGAYSTGGVGLLAHANEDGRPGRRDERNTFDLRPCLWFLADNVDAKMWRRGEAADKGEADA